MDLAARLPHPQTESGRDLVHGVRVCLGLVRIELELAGVLGGEKK
jgi:hypothetical protein